MLTVPAATWRLSPLARVRTGFDVVLVTVWITPTSWFHCAFAEPTCAPDPTLAVLTSPCCSAVMPSLPARRTPSVGIGSSDIPPQRVVQVSPRTFSATRTHGQATGVGTRCRAESVLPTRLETPMRSAGTHSMTRRSCTDSSALTSSPAGRDGRARDLNSTGRWPRRGRALPRRCGAGALKERGAGRRSRARRRIRSSDIRCAT
jgi:hypothetical protein